MRLTDEASSAPQPLKVGSVLGTFSLTRLLGKGTSSEVFYAENVVTQAVAAVKVLRAELHQLPDVVRRFEIEARTTNLVRHEHIVEIYDIGLHSNGQHYILFEYLEGQTLAKMMEQPIEHALATRLVLQLCAGLGAAHAKGVVHRDLKPANVFVVQSAGQPQVKIVDFGVARRAELDAGEARTSFGTIFGTALYMSPEQTLGKEVDNRADIYSLGVLMYELATGKVPFGGENAYEVMRAQVHDLPPPPRMLNRQVSPAYEEVILRCLSKSPADRWASMADLGRAIAAAINAPEGNVAPATFAARPAIGAGPTLAVSALAGVRGANGTVIAPVVVENSSTQRLEPRTEHALHVPLARSGADVRKEPRVATSFGVQVFSEQGMLLGQAVMTDVSLGGAFLRTTLALPLFSRIRFVGHSNSGRLEALGEIVRLELGEGQQGFGLRFDPLPPEQQRLIETLQRPSSPVHVANGGDTHFEVLLRNFEVRASSGDHYALLGVPKDAPNRRIRDVCERLSAELMPQRFPKMSPKQRERLDRLRGKLTSAEEDLVDAGRRALYDAVSGNVLGVLRCITEGLDLERLDELREKFLVARPDAEALTRGPLQAAADAERAKNLPAALERVADALCHDPLNMKLHRKAADLRLKAKLQRPSNA